MKNRDEIMRRVQSLGGAPEDVQKLVGNTLAEFGAESMEVANLYLAMKQHFVGRVVKPDSNPAVQFDMHTEDGYTLSYPTILDWYVFRDSSLIDEHIEEIEAAFAFAMPTWLETDPAAFDFAVNTLLNLGNYYTASGNLKKWKAFSRRVLNIFRTRLGSYPRLVVALRDMGVHCYRLGKLDQADACFKEALTICESDSDLKTTEAPGLLLNSAGVAFKRGHMVEARLLLDKVMEMLEQTPIVDKVVLLEALTNYAAVFRATGNLEEFDRVSLRAEETAKEVWKSKPTSVVTPALALVRSREELNRCDDAERLMKWLLDEMVSLPDGKSETDAHVHVKAHFLSDCRENGIPASVEKMDPEIMAELSG